MKTLSATHAEQLVSQLRRDAISNMLAAATRMGLDEEGLQTVISWLDMANDLPPAEIEKLRGHPLGEAIANTIIYLQRTNELSQPIAAPGLKRFARTMLVLGLSLCGLVVGLEHHTLAGGLLAAAVGLAVAAIVGREYLGGTPERRYAVSRLISLADIYRDAAVAQGVGPNPLAASLAALTP